MQIQLISIRLERPFTDAEVERLLRLVPPERRQRRTPSARNKERVMVFDNPRNT